MRHHSLPIGILAIACGLLANAAPARAAAATWVSGTGSDTGNCRITAPCRTFSYAHGQTTNNGAINVLSAGSFGPVTITKSISIVADGVEAVINAGADGAAIIVQAAANRIVSLRGLTIDLRGTDNNRGIDFVSGAALHVHKCVVRKSTYGILFRPASGTSELYVADSVIADSSIHVEPSGSGGAKVVLDRVRAENSSFSGIIFIGNTTTGSITATVRDSVSAGNGGAGILAADFGGGTTTVMVDRSALVNNNSTGISAQGGATIRIGDSTASGNSIGLSAQSGGVIASYGTNKVNDNVMDVSGTITPVAYK